MTGDNGTPSLTRSARRPAQLALVGLCIAVLLALAALAWWAAERRARSADAEMRQTLLLDAAEVAQLVAPDEVRKLTFTEADKGTPAFVHIEEQMANLKQPARQRGIYSMALRGGGLVFGPETYPEGDPMASPSGTPYEKPVPEYFRVFEDKRPVVVGPYTDEYGTFVTGAAPVLDPGTGDVLMVVGVDVLAHDWRARLAAARRGPLVSASVLALGLAAGALALRLRRRVAGPGPLRFRGRVIAPTAIALSVGLGLSTARQAEQYRETSRRAALAVTERARSEWGGLVATQVLMLRVETDHIARDPTILQVWQGRDLNSLSAAAQTRFEGMNRAYRVTHMCFIEPDGTCLLCVQDPSRRGDRIDPGALLTAQNTGEEAWGTELGPLGTFTLRVVRPCSQGDRLLGYVELGMELEYLETELGRLMNAQVLTAIRKEFTTRERYEAGRRVFRFTGDWDTYPEFVVAHQALPEIPASADQWLRNGHGQSEQSQPFTVRQGASTLSGGNIHVPDTMGRDVADFVVLRDATADANAAHSDLLLNACMLGVLCAGVIALLWSLTGSAERRLSDAFEALREGESKFRALFETTRDALMILDEEEFIDCNAATLRTFGCSSRDEFLGKHPSELSPPVQLSGQDSRTAADERIAAAMRDGSARFEWMHRRVDGSVFPAEVLLSRCELGGRPVLQASVRDITQLKEAERAVHESEAKFRELFEATRDALMILDEERFLDCNQATLDTLRCSSRDDFLGKHPSDLSPPFQPSGRDSRTAADEMIATAMRDGSARFEWLHGRIDGSLFPAEVVLSRCELGGKLVLLSSVRDITQLKEAERAVRDSEARIRAITDSAQDAILMMDADGRVSYWNPAAETMFGWTGAEAIGRNLHELIAPERFLEVHRAAYAEFQQTGQGAAVGKTLELPARCKDDNEITIALSLAAVRMEDGWHAVGILRDVTEAKRAEEALRQSRAELEEANARLQSSVERANEMALQAEAANIAKSQFLANMSHEIRTPMNGVIGMIGLLLDTGLTDEQRRYGEVARSSADSLLSLINDILDFSKVEADKLELEELDFDVRVLLEDTAESLALRAQGKGLELTCRIDPLVHTFLRGDPGRLRQILVNLGGNAVKFTSTGEVSVQVTLESETEDRLTARFEVRDTGIGIPADKTGLLFNAFQQVDASTTRQFGGTGLGLAICKRLVELMGGEIGVESTEGHGSTFWFTAVFRKQPPRERGPWSSGADIRGVRVLAVDDNATNRLVLAEQLGSWGVRHLEAGSASQALEMLRAAHDEGDPFRIVLTDMTMPDMDGESLSRAIKEDRDLRDTALVMLTSLGKRGDARRLESLGFAAYLTKPVKQSQLYDCLATVLGGIQSGSLPTPALVTRHTVTEARRRNVRVLLAEDNATNQMVALKILEKLGYRADAVADGREAIRALEMVPYDIVFMDVQMPVMDGLEATSAIRSGRTKTPDPQIPIVALTAHAMGGDRERCLAAGMNDYVTKPIAPRAIADALDRWLSGPERRHAASHSSSDAVHDAERRPVFDRDALRARLMGDEGLVGQILGAFLEDVPGQVAALRESVAGGHTESARAQAHKIGGAAANVGGIALSSVAALIARAESMEEIAPLVPELERELRLLEVMMREAE